MVVEGCEPDFIKPESLGPTAARQVGFLGDCPRDYEVEGDGWVVQFQWRIGFYGCLVVGGQMRHIRCGVAGLLGCYIADY